MHEVVNDVTYLCKQVERPEEVPFLHLSRPINVRNLSFMGARLEVSMGWEYGVVATSGLEQVAT